MSGAPSSVEAAVVGHALNRGWLRREQLREALLLQGQLEASGRPTPLLAILLARYLRAEHVEELKAVYHRAALSAGEAAHAAAGPTLPPPAAALPHDCLRRSGEELKRPPERDPEAVRRFIAACEASTLECEPPQPAPGAPPAPAPGEEAVRAARARGRRAYREAHQLDPHFAPHADDALEQVEVLGEGGMGVVYRVRDRRLGREAALKLVRSDQADEDGVLRFRREAEITARLTHPSIPPVYEAGTNAQGLHYMLMRVVEGQPLARHIKDLHEAPGDGSRAGTSQRELLEALVKVGEAVAYAHERGIIHRDLKPQNVLIGQFGEVMVVDWGLARDLSLGAADEALLRRSLDGALRSRPGVPELTQEGSVLGTPGYMPPEQAEGKPVDTRADVFALGALLCCVLTGRPPIVGTTVFNKLYATQQGKIELPRDRRADVPPELNSIAARALAMAAEDRYPSAAGFVADLRAYLAGEAVSAHRYSLGERAQRAARRHVTLLVGASVGALALLGIGLALAFAARQQAKAKQEETERRLAEEARAESERSSRALADEKARTLVYTDAGRLRILARQAAELGVSSEEVDALQRWLNEARALLDEARVETHRGRQRALQATPAQTMAQQAELEALEQLLSGLVVLARVPAPGQPPLAQTVAGVEARLALARTVREQTVSGPAASSAWAEASRAIQESPRYSGLRLSPVEGLVPLGADPDSGLWEFWHVASGERPERGPEGHLRPTEQSGLVFVLVPAGSFRMGSLAASDEQPVHEVRLNAFLLSKYEVTQGQWLRATGRNPSKFSPGGSKVTLLHPVERVSWHQCANALKRLGLTLPSEAQWEYACRGGTTSPWWTGAERTSLQGAGNLADGHCKRNGGPGGWAYDEWLDDGWTPHAPAGSFRANPFGLHDMVGNVWEWVQDSYHDSYEGAPRDGSAWVDADEAERVLRGGSYSTVADASRSASRRRNAPAGRSDFLGLRPAIVIQR
ncbi:MAG: SUMF1/EgtB/PvdO family nonheme iron enzyme [Planctomycetes bacterium]|nr:SUMF1/EgtB/PvdO family nonheme iron enzyme [Planctomycetota bacterium]